MLPASRRSSSSPEAALDCYPARMNYTFASATILLAERIQRIAGDRFVVALERLMGLVLVAVSIEMMLRGIKTFAGQLIDK